MNILYSTFFNMDIIESNHRQILEIAIKAYWLLPSKFGGIAYGKSTKIALWNINMRVVSSLQSTTKVEAIAYFVIDYCQTLFISL